MNTMVPLHCYCTILNTESIDDNFYVNRLLTVGEVNGRRSIIGTNVSIYTGAKVKGDNVKIGAGTILGKDVPSNMVVFGNPIKVIKKLNVGV